MKPIRSNVFLDLFADKKVKGSMPRKIRAAGDKPTVLSQEDAVLFDRFKRVSAKSVKKHRSCVIVTGNADVYEAAPEEVAIVLVPDAEAAYWKFVTYYRQLFRIPVMAVTGTCGKTTTKEMIRHILADRYLVQATIRSKNAGRFHLPYLLGIRKETDVAVFETGVAKAGDLLESCRYFQPTVGVVTNIGVDHLNAFASHADYIKAKDEILPGLSYAGTLVLNADDSNIATFDLAAYRGRILTFGLGEKADFRAKNVRMGKGGMECTLVYQQLEHPLFVPGYGTHNVYNALAAITAAYSVGVGIATAAERVRSYQHLSGHMNVLPGLKGSLVIDDTWNANPTSMKTAIQVLGNLANGRKKVAILGRMAALGSFADTEYEGVAQYLVDSGVDVLITKGSIARDFAKHARKLGMRRTDVHACSDAEEVLRVLDRIIDDQSIVLVKTSMNDAESADLIKRITASSSHP